jgi:hypothetical protein
MMNISSKGLEPTTKKIGDYEFYIRPFSAFVAANISGELISVLAPAFGSLAAMFSASDEGQDSVADYDLAKSSNSIVQALQSVDGDRLEGLMKTLLVKHENIAFSKIDGDSNDVERLDSSRVNQIFTGEIENMFILAWEVIKLNYKGFFKKLNTPSGAAEGLLRKAGVTKNTEPLT